MERIKRLLTIALTILLMCIAAAGCASVTDGRMVANIDKIETYGTTLHVLGWVYDQNAPSATVTIHVDSVAAYSANKAKQAGNSTCPVSGNHYFDFTYAWKNEGVRVMINALYTSGSGAFLMYDNISVFPDIYTVKYNANGGTGAPATDYKHRSISLRLSEKIPTRTGYTFKGWSKSSTGTVAYAAKGSYTSDASTTLYAVWEKNTYTLNYDANGGTGAPSSQSAVYQSTLVLSDAVPTYEGHDFLGWATAKDSSADYQPGGSYVISENATLYAVWQLKTYPVHYDANGGAGAPDSQTKTHGEALTLSSAAPTREDYVFLGWAESAGATEATWQSGDVYSENAPLTLYAVWKEARVPGDVNGDKAVNDADAQLLLSYLADLPVTIVEANSDVTADGAIDGRDALRLLKHLAGTGAVLQ